MKIRTTAQLRDYLRARRASPEVFARETKVSNMTIRRLLKRAPHSPIPEKYEAQFDRVTDAEGDSILAGMLGTTEAKEDFGAFIVALEAEGSKVSDVSKVWSDVKGKLEDPSIGRSLREQVAKVLKSMTSASVPARKKALCIGALLYLLNPIDLIPDSIPVVGYLDDFAVISFAVGSLGDSSDPTTPARPEAVGEVALAAEINSRKTRG